MKIINARVYDYFAQIEQDKNDEFRKSTVGTGDRSERSVPTTSRKPRDRPPHRLALQKLDTILSGS